MKFHKNGKGITCVVGVILFVVICASIFSKQKFYVSNGIMHEITWRYNISISKDGDDFLISSFDKITRESVIKTFSASKEKAVQHGNHKGKAKSSYYLRRRRGMFIRRSDYRK